MGGAGKTYPLHRDFLYISVNMVIITVPVTVLHIKFIWKMRNSAYWWNMHLYSGSAELTVLQAIYVPKVNDYALFI